MVAALVSQHPRITCRNPTEMKNLINKSEKITKTLHHLPRRNYWDLGQENNKVSRPMCIYDTPAVE